MSEITRISSSEGLLFQKVILISLIYHLERYFYSLDMVFKWGCGGESSPMGGYVVFSRKGGMIYYWWRHRFIRRGFLFRREIVGLVT